MIKLGVIGLGSRISSFINNCLRKVEPNLRVVGIVDPDEAGVRKRLTESDRKDVVFYPNMKEMVLKGKPDGLLIGTRCNLHTPYAIEAANYDLPLFLEKPVAISMEQALALERAFEQSKCQAVVSFPLRVSPLCMMTRQYIAEGKIGKPVHIAALNYVSYGMVYWEQEYRNYDITRGLFLQKATHDLDYMMFLMNMKIVRVAAMTTQGQVFGGKERSGLVCSECEKTALCLESPINRKRNSSGGHEGDHNCVFSVDCGNPRQGTNEDASSAIIEFEDGSHGIYTQVFFARRDAARRGSIISGYHGTLDFDWYRNDIKYVRHHAPFSDTIKAGEGMSHFGGDLELAHDFIRILKGGGNSRTTIYDGLQSVYACLAAKESSEKGVFVQVRQVGQ
ncbi:MAG: Gfo/Idh/MocA family oxidoreductase [Victivallales bacterium]|nr:Gfo/Idh/MocA family oxidoreductase [Victivallales bacterium]